MLRAVIFDMDGLLADTEWPDFLAWQELFRECGGDLTVEEWIEHVGVWGASPMPERLARLRGTVEGIDELRSRRRARYRELVRQTLVPLPGVTVLIDALVASRLPCAVASSSDRDWVAFVLEGLALRQRMEVIVTGDDVPARKPAPDVYLTAASRLGVAPGECVAFEDSAVGVAAACAAGMRCVAVPHRLTAGHDLSTAHARVDSLLAVDITWLERLFAE